MGLIDFVGKLLASVAISVVALLITIYVYVCLFFRCFRDGYRNVFSWKDRSRDSPPLHYTNWDAETRKSSPLKGRKWNHAYVTVPQSGLRFHYVYSGTVPSDISISEIDGETTHVVDNNNIITNRPKLLLCVHGYPENWFSWRHILRYFDKPHPDVGDYFVVAVDMRGFGDSDKPSGYKSYHLDLLCSDVKTIALALGYEKFSVVGHDWGGAIAWDVAKNYPNSMEKAFVLNGPEMDSFMQAAFKSPMQCLKSWYILFFQFSWTADLYIRLQDYGFITEVLCSKESGIANTENRLTDEEMEMFKYGVRKSITAPTNYYRALLWPFAQPGPGLLYPKDVVSDDPIKHTKTLFLFGEKDTFLTKGIAEATARRLNPKNGSKLVFVKDASHWLQQDNPDEVIQHMVEFLKQ